MPEQDWTSKPEGEPLFMLLDTSSAEYLATIDDARRTLDTFESLFDQYGSNPSIYFAFKVEIPDGEDLTCLWYSLETIEGGVYSGRHFEIPNELVMYSTVTRPRDEILDWMVIDGGVLYGGHSIRYQRTFVSDQRKHEFDQYSGIREYGEI